MFRRPVIFMLVLAVLFAKAGWAQPNVRYDVTPNPYLFVLREPAVLDELRLTDQQRRAVLAVNERFDGPLLAVRIPPPTRPTNSWRRFRAAPNRKWPRF
jgi:hypothetical protein